MSKIYGVPVDGRSFKILPIIPGKQYVAVPTVPKPPKPLNKVPNIKQGPTPPKSAA